jgi:hypothetical protein
MSGMGALGVANLLLTGARLERDSAQLVLEHRQLLIRCIAQPHESGFLSARVGGLGRNVQKRVRGPLAAALCRTFFVALVAHVFSAESNPL